MADIGDIFSKITWGSVPTWLQFCLLLTILWKGVPAFLDAVSNRQSKIEERMGALLDSATARFEEQLAASDKRHEDCMEGQEKLRKVVDDQGQRIEKQSHQISGQADTIAKLQEDIAGYRKQIGQLQVSSLRTAGQPVPDIIMEGMLGQLDRIPGKGQ